MIGKNIFFLMVLLLGGLVMSNVDAAENIYAFKAADINGNEVTLDQYQGKVLLIVNTASKCGFTPQYASLQKLYEKYQAQGFEILAFPANDFGRQEPGTNEEIKEFCDLRFKIKFPLFSKISVAGSGMHPLYQYLTEQTGFEGPIQWNFTKFLIDAGGHVTARYASKVDPLSAEVTASIENVLKKSKGD